ncbi:hypothetical protein ONZ45_g11504 [Pleurotus djamor]|nr:hypothetical protein ONZ45_g11504 [Pleurotus djamor]
MFNVRLAVLSLFCGFVLASPIGNSTHLSFVNQAEADQYAQGSFVLQDVPVHLGRKSTFHRAVTKEELQLLTKNYPIGGAPLTHSKSGGDFTVEGTGGLYVFDDEDEAVLFGRCHSDLPSKTWPYSYVVTFEYTPNTRLYTKSFTTDNDAWKKLIDNCAAHVAHQFDIVEGPYSMYSGPKRRGAPRSGEAKKNQMLWQAAFIGRDALQTLRVTKHRKVKTLEGKLPTCTIF